MSKRTCKVDGCSGEALARLMCRSHYNRWHYSGDTSVNKNYSPNCPVCGTVVIRRNPKGPVPMYCSTDCQKARYRENARKGYEEQNARRREDTKRRRMQTVINCRQCGVGFFPDKSLRRLYCSDYCSRKWVRENNPNTCLEPGCDDHVRAHGRCLKHYKRWGRETGRIVRERTVWTEERKAAYHLRRARKKGVGSENVVPLDVFDRDGWVCGVCGESVDRSLVYPDPGSASLDHVVPLSRGGAHSYANTQLAHLFCNVSKGDSLPVSRDEMPA